MRCNINDLMCSLKSEDAAIFSSLTNNDWTIELEAHKFVWKNYELNEIHGPFDDNEEAIAAARTIYQQITKATPTNSDSTVPPAPENSAESHRQEADEADLLDAVFKFLEAHGGEPRRNVPCESGVADIVSNEAVYRIKCTVTPENLPPLVRETAAFCNDISPTLDAVIVTCCSQDIETLKAIADEDKVYVVTLDELQNRFDAAPAREASASLFPIDQTGNSSVLVQQIDPARCSTHPSLLMRANGLDEEYVKELEAGYLAGKTYPASDIFDDGEHLWVADGNHRHAGALRAKAPFDINYHKGTLRDAIIFAMRANAAHGLRPSHDDKRLKALTLLSDSSWFKESDTVLANDIAGGAITQPFISSVRRDLARLLPALQTEAGHLGDDELAAHVNVSPGLVRVLRRRLPEPVLESLTQNVLGDDGRRRGADRIVRSTPGKQAAVTAEEPTLPLIEEEDSEAGVREEENASPITPSPAVVESRPADDETDQVSQVSSPLPSAADHTDAVHHQEDTTARRVESDEAAPPPSDVTAAAPVPVETETPEVETSPEIEEAWGKASIVVTMTLMPDDGHVDGRRVLIVTHEAGGAPLTNLTRARDVLPTSGPLRELVDRLRNEMPTRLSQARSATTATPTARSGKKKAARADKGASASKKSGAKKAAAKKSPTRKPTAGAK